MSENLNTKKTYIVDSDMSAMKVLGGLFILAWGVLSLFQILVVDGVGGSLKFAIFIIAISAILILIGLHQALGVIRLIVDKSNNTLTRLVRVIFPIWRRRYELDKVSRVSISWYGGSANEYDPSLKVYIVCGKKMIRVYSTRRYEQARSMADELGRIIGCPVFDGTTKDNIHRKPELLGKTLQELERISSTLKETPTPPSEVTTEFKIEGGTSIFTLPRPRVSIPLLFSILILIGVWLFLSFILTIKAEPFKLIIPMFMIVLATAYLLPRIIAAIIRMIQSDELIVTSEDITLKYKTVLGTQEVQIKSDSIMDVDICPVRIETPDMFSGHHIRVYSRERILKFGYSMPEKELKWLRDTLVFYLVAREQHESH